MGKKEAWEATVGRTLALPVGDLDRTWDLLVFYSGLFGKTGAHAWSSYSTLVFFKLLDFISMCEAALLTSQVHGNRQYLSIQGWVGPTDEPASSTGSFPPALPVCDLCWCWVRMKHAPLTLGGNSLPAKWELPDSGSWFIC